MKSFNGLYVRMLDLEEIKAAIREAAKHKTRRPEVKKALENIDEKAAEIRDKLASGTWTPPAHALHRLQEGSHKKERLIRKPRWDDEQIVHHVLMRQFVRIAVPRIYRYACGVVPGRGPLYAARTLKRWRDEYGGRRFYVAELDIKKFYDNIDTDILVAMLRRFIRDKRYLSILEDIINAGAPGLPKGFYSSPWLANFYLSGLDAYIKQELRPNHYLRYMDNLFLLHTNKRQLHRMVWAIETYLAGNLHLELNNSKQVFRMERDGRGRIINAVGYVIHADRMTMRKAILRRARAKALRMKRIGRCRRIDAATILSYKGWFDRTDTYGYFQRWVKPYVSIRYCRKRMAKFGRDVARGRGKIEPIRREDPHDDDRGDVREARGDYPVAV